MAIGTVVVHVTTMASGGTLTGEINLDRSFNKVYLDPTGANSEVRIQACHTSGGTYRQVYHPSINSSTVGANIFKIPSSVSGGIIELPNGLRYIKIETTAAVSDGATFEIICADN